MANSSTYILEQRKLTIKVGDLLQAPTSVIVNPANSGLSHGGGVAGQISDQGGELIQQESDEIISKLGSLDSGSAVFTQAGRLPYQAIIHAVGPRMGEGDEQDKIELALRNCLQLCDYHNWPSIALPAISTGIFSVPISTFSLAFYRAINSYWRTNLDSLINDLILYVSSEHFLPVIDDFSQHLNQDSSASKFICLDKNELPNVTDSDDDNEESVGFHDLSEQSNSNNDDIEDWFV